MISSFFDCVVPIVRPSLERKEGLTAKSSNIWYRWQTNAFIQCG